MSKLEAIPIICLLVILLLLGEKALAGAKQIAPTGATALSARNSHEKPHGSSKDFHGIVGVMAVTDDAPTGWDPAYTRSECIVRVRVKAYGHSVTAKQWLGIESRSLAIWMFEAQKFGLAAIDYQERSHSVYLLYAKGCNKKYYTTNLLFAQMKNSIIEFPDYEVLHQRVKPSYHTVFICGHWWKDGEQGDCYQNLTKSPGSGKETGK